MKIQSLVFQIFLIPLCLGNPPNDATVEFLNGDVLSGNVISLNSNSLLLNHPAFRSENNIGALLSKEIKVLTFQNREKVVQPSKNMAHVTMFGRYDKSVPLDFFKGDFDSINDEFLFLKNSYAGTLRIKREFIKKIDIVGKDTAILPGLGKLEDWEAKVNSSKPEQEGDWFAFKMKSGTARDYFISRKVKIPNKFRLDLSLKTNTNINAPSELHLGTEASGNMNTKSNTIILSISSRRILVNVRGARGHKSIATKILQNSLKEIDLSLYFDAQIGTLSLELNGKLIVDQHPVLDFKEREFGDYINFKSSRYSNLFLKKIVLKNWHGTRQGTRPEDRLALKGQIGRPISLKNGDTVYGNIEGVKDGYAQIKTKYGTIPIRIDKITSFKVIDGKNNELIMQENDARLTFLDGSKFIVKIEKIEDQKIFASSQGFEGIQEFQLEWVKKIEFQGQIYK